MFRVLSAEKTGPTLPHLSGSDLMGMGVPMAYILEPDKTCSCKAGFSMPLTIRGQRSLPRKGRW